MKIVVPPKRIVAAVDLSEPSLAALAAAKELAARAYATLEVVYAQSPDVPLRYSYDELDMTAAEAMREEQRRFKKEWHEVVRAKCADMPRGTLRVGWLRGFAVDALTAVAAPPRCDLLVIGTHGRKGARRALAGSISEAVCDRARVPVLCVRASGFKLGAGILAPYNMEPYSDPAIRYANALAELLDVPVTALHVGRHGERREDCALRLKERLDDVLEGACACRLRALVRLGEPRAEIAAEMERGRYGLLALASHRKHTVGDWALGGTADRLLRRTRGALLAVPAAPVKAAPRRTVVLF